MFASTRCLAVLLHAACIISTHIFNVHSSPTFLPALPPHPALPPSRYGHISFWNVGGVTDFSKLFKKMYSFNEDLSLWDMSSATTLSGMFQHARSFNKPVKLW